MGDKGIEMSDHEALLETLEARFRENPHRHEGVAWNDVRKKLEANPEKLAALARMEETGGEPDVVGYEASSKTYRFVDCSPESPSGRRSICFDRKGWESRKKHRPENNAVDMAAEMGIEILTEEEYRELQTLGEFDQKSSSWVRTPEAIRKLGGALFCDRRYGAVFVYHNGAQSYYAGRGFRGGVRV